jgi:hypothetical protein
LKQPWAPGRNRFAVFEYSQRIKTKKQATETIACSFDLTYSAVI